LVVRTGLDLTLQRQTELSVEQILREYGDQYNASQASVVVMDVEGTMRALVGGRDYGSSQFNRATDALRQPGSSFKPLVYGAAFRAGLINSRSTVVDRPICLGNWCPQNYGRSFSGAQTAHMAMVKSINTIPVILTQQMGRGDSRIGREKIIELAREMGVQRPITNTAPMPIGAAELTLVDLTNIYATYAAGGRKVTPHSAIEIKNTAGEVLWRADRDMGPPRQVVTPEVAADMNSMLVGVVEQGTGRRAAVDGHQVGGKTGTTNSYRDALFVGYSGHFVTGVWYGNDDYAETNRMTGGSLPAMTFKLVMTAAHQGLERKPVFGQPDTTPRPPQGALANAPLPGGVPERPQVLSRRSLDVLGRIDRLMREAEAQVPLPTARPQGPLTSLGVAAPVLR
jgi:penicillin-binding protein 1A